MFENLLVPLDGTPLSNAALPFARALAQACRGRIVLLRVLDPAVLSAQDRLEQPAIVLQQLERIASELRMSDIEVNARVSTGEVTTEILRVAECEHANALVAVAHASRLERLVDNRTTSQLLARSRLPMFVVRPGGRRISMLRTLLVAVDGTPGAAQALDEAVALARVTDAAMVLVRVISPPEHFEFDPLVAATLGAQRHADSDAYRLAVAEQYVGKIARKLRARGLHATPRVMVGLPAERILAAADQLDADLIVMSTHGYVAPLRSLLGSTADEVVRAADRPVLLVRRTDGVGTCATL